jgi:protein-tyrosine-phosphatase
VDAPLPFRIFYVCTGNQARSPLAAAWTARALAPLPVLVGSAGTLPGRPSPALPEAIDAAAQLGIDLSGHSSSHVTAHDLSPADLVLGFQFHHVAAAVVEGRAPAGKTFLVKELARLLRDVPRPPHADPFVAARIVIAGADELRRRIGHVAGEEIRDPAGRRQAVFRDIVVEVVRSCEELFGLLFPV